jgi:alginate O-acetyltransferase complex protein AlgI
MAFSSRQFILQFLPLTLAGYWLLARPAGKTVAKVYLVIASLWFYSHGSPKYVPLLVFTTVFNYLIVYRLARCGRDSLGARLLVTLAVVENLGFLIYYKYSGFILDNLNRVFGTSYSVTISDMPLGISFYTFLILSCVVDVYREGGTELTFLDFATFVTFFPQLIVGPVSRQSEVIPQLRREQLLRPDSKDIMLGMTLFSLGCVKKILIADPLIRHAQAFYGTTGSGFFEAWGAVLAYTFAYYFDFSGYADMAVGLGLFFNVKLPFNFDSPYKAKDFADFWRRWNITVSQFFHRHVFQSIFHFGDSLGRLMAATMATFLVSGLWHGAAWHFVFWGALNGLLVCVSHIMTIRRVRLPSGIARASTFFLILLTRVLFDSSSMTQAASVYRSLFGLGSPPGMGASTFVAEGASYVRANLPIFSLLLVSAVTCFYGPDAREISERFRPKWYHAALAGAAFIVSLFFMGRVSTFLYFQF